MKIIPVFCVLPLVSRLVQAAALVDLDKGEWQEETAGLLPRSPFLPSSFSETTALTRGTAGGIFRRWFQSATGRVTRLFSRRTLEKEALKKEAIRSYADNDRGWVHRNAICITLPEESEFRSEKSTLCDGFPERASSLCRHLFEWTYRKLLEVKRNCPRGLTASACLAGLKIPLTHPLVTERRPEAIGRTPYMIRKKFGSADAQSQLLSLKDTTGDTYKLLTHAVSTASTTQLLASEKLKKYLQQKTGRSAAPNDRKSLLGSLRFYFASALLEAPAVDPLLLRILWSLTTKSCANTARRRIDLDYQGQKVRITVEDVLMVFWSDLIYDATHFIEDDCLEDPESNCAVLRIYLKYKASLDSALQDAALHEDFNNHALDMLIRMYHPEHEQLEPDARALANLADTCSRTAATDFLYGLQASKIRFRRLINYMGRRRWSRAVLMSLVRKRMRQMMHDSETVSSPTTLQAASPRSPEEIVGLALYYGFTNGAKAWLLTGSKGLGLFVDSILREEVLKMWTHQHTHSAGVPSSSTNKSFIQQSLHRPRFSSWRAAPRRLSVASAVHADLKQLGIFKRSPLELAFVERKWSPKKKRLVFGIGGAALMLVAISGLTGGALISLLFPLLFLFTGIIMCLVSIILSLKTHGLLSQIRDRLPQEEND